MSTSNEGGGRDGSASPGKRKSPSPGTDTSHTQRGTSHEYEGESVASENHDDDGAPPIAKRQKVEADVDTLITQTETSQGDIEIPATNIQQDYGEALGHETELPSSPTVRANNEGGDSEDKGQQTQPGGDKNEQDRNEKDNTQDEEEAPIPKSPPKPEPKLCGICNTQPSKYKCPQPGCQVAYCSVACNKLHKENHPPPPPPPAPAPPSSKQAEQPTTSATSTTKPDPYEVLLHHRAEFDRLLQRYPGLERVLKKIHQCTLPPPDQPSLTGGVPSSILQATGGVSGYNPLISAKDYYGGKGKGSNTNNRQPQIWTGEVGLRKGAEALKKARTDPGIHGDGVREFCELVMYLLNNPSLRPAGSDAADKTSLNATSLVREEVVADQAKLIKKLLEVEGGGDDL